MPRTAGEVLFEEYLTSRKIGWDYEESNGTRSTRPDYTLRVEPVVIVDVKDFEKNAADRMLRQIQGMIGVDPYGRIRDKIQKANEKVKAHRDRGLPCVLVLHDTSSFINFSSETVAGAMHGNVGFTIQVGDVEMDPRPHFDGRTARLRENLNTTISAVAVFERFRPNDDLMQDELGSGSVRRLVCQRPMSSAPP